MSESDTDLDNSYVFNKSREGTMQYKKHNKDPAVTQRDTQNEPQDKTREGTMQYRKYDMCPQVTLRDKQNEPQDKEPHAPVGYRQAYRVQGAKEQYKDENNHKAKLSAIDTYLELRNRDKESAVPGQQAYSDNLPGTKHQPKEYSSDYLKSRDTTGKRACPESRSRSREQEYSLKDKEADAKKESEAFIKSDVCSSLLSIKNRENPSTGSPKYSPHYVSDLKKLTNIDIESKAQKESYTGKLSTERDKDDETRHYHINKKELEPESVGLSKPHREVSPYRPRGKEMKKTCEGIVSENAKLLESCYETSRSSTPIMQITDGRETYLDKEILLDKESESDIGNPDKKIASQSIREHEDTRLDKYTELEKMTHRSNIIADNEELRNPKGDHIRKKEKNSKDVKIQPKNENPLIQTMPVKVEAPIPLFMEASGSTGGISTETGQTMEEKLFESEFPSFSAYLKRTYGQTYQYRQREMGTPDSMPPGTPDVEEKTKRVMVDNDHLHGQMDRVKVYYDHKGPMERDTNCDKENVYIDHRGPTVKNKSCKKDENFDKENVYNDNRGPTVKNKSGEKGKVYNDHSGPSEKDKSFGQENVYNDHRGPLEKDQRYDEQKLFNDYKGLTGKNRSWDKESMYNDHRVQVERDKNCDQIPVIREPISRDHPNKNFEENMYFDRNRESKMDAGGYRYHPEAQRNQETLENYSPRSNESTSPRAYRDGQYMDSKFGMETHTLKHDNDRMTDRKMHRNDAQSPQTQQTSQDQFTDPSSAETRYRKDNAENKNFESSTFLSRSKESVYEASGLSASSTQSFNKQLTQLTKVTDYEDASPTISLLEQGFNSMLDMKTCSSRPEPRPNSPSPNRNHEENFSETSRSRSRSRTKKKNVQSQVKNHKQVHATHKSSPNIKISPTQFGENELGTTANQKMKYGEKESYEAINRDLQERSKHSNTDEQKLSDDFYMEDEFTKFGKMDYLDKAHTLHKSSPNLREIEQIYANVKPDNSVNLNNKYSETYPIGLNDQDTGMNRKHSHNKKDEMSEMFYMDKQNFRKIYVQNRVMDLKQEAMQRGNYLNSPKYDSYSLDGEDTSTQRKSVKSRSKMTNREGSWFSEQEPLYPENYYVSRKMSADLDPKHLASPARSVTSSTEYCRSDPGMPSQVHHAAFIHESPTRISVGTQMQDFEDQKDDQQNPPKSRIRHKTLAYGVSGQDLDQAKIDADDDFKQRTYFCEADQQRENVAQVPLDPNLDIEYKKLSLVNDELLKMWEQAQAENTRLRLEMSDVKNENETLRHQLGSAAKQVSQINAMTDAEKREKQIVVKKLAEMEEELKLLALSENLTDQTLDQLKSDNARLREENDALMRAMTSKQK
eukprot:TRINITY_DN6836_c0_g1_i1.p1 TRINITY_DN6836_c0_g1~~TRINITY_DN6836_c0_g1_i1.p1  ORF type:complete len:1415 (-),score=336.65 TRINITY_DN6836_c0_g1_i1:219-4286(-)